MCNEKVILLSNFTHLITNRCSLANDQWVLLFKSKVTYFNYCHTQKC